MYRFFAIILLVLGTSLLASATLPILGYEVFKKPKFSRSLISPVPQEEIPRRGPLDLTKASNWFKADVETGGTIPSSIEYYTLSIPKLKIERATVKIGGEDLSESLIHYKGTASPGRSGNAVIFGHSVLPQFFDPKNYLTIFSTLPNLKIGDLVIIDYDGITYKFVIKEMFEVAPSEIEVLHQYYNSPHLTLITCVPPGTYLRRLVVRAELVPPEI